MLLGLISDIHDNTINLRAALDRLRALPCDTLLFMGDLESLSTLRLLRDQWHGTLHLVLGNNDTPEPDFLRTAEQLPHTHHHGRSADIQVGGRRIFMTHSPRVAEQALTFAPYDAVFYGHTHLADLQSLGTTLFANPGDLQGRYGAPSYAVYDTTAHSVTHYSL